MALHENYVDYYPNYPGFDSAAIALNSEGKRMLSWLNRSTGVQSFSVKPAWMVKNAATQSPEIHRRYGTTGSYLDVNSSDTPSGHGDMDAAAPGAGTLAAWLAGDTALWSFERKTHAGPVLGEGRSHWYFSGLLDGVEAQFGAGDIKENQGRHAPLFVDFDLQRIHPLEVNHGMGYYERWLAKGERIAEPLTIDAYRMQEIAFGHAPFLGRDYWNDIPFAFVESNLVAPVAKRYGTASVMVIEYQVGGVWRSASAAARSGDFSRVRVGYDKGLIIVENSRRATLGWRGLELPQYGWAAKAKGLVAYTAWCGRTVCDYAETATSLFANARARTDTRSEDAAPSENDSRLNRAGVVVNFGSIQTDGMVSIREENGQWVLRPFPRSRNFTVRLQRARFPMPVSVLASDGEPSSLKPVPAGAYWSVPLNGAQTYAWPVLTKRQQRLPRPATAIGKG
jgi:hypothetical protein